MSNVTLLIGGRSYTVACATGEEAHIARLGRMIDAKVDGVTVTGATSETRMLLFAALLLADDLHEANARLASHMAAVPDTPAQAALPAVSARQLERLADRLENLAGRLEDERPHA